MPAKKASNARGDADRTGPETPRDAQRMFRAFFELSNAAMAIASADKHWVRVNAAFEQLLGYAESELAPLTWAAVTHPDDLADEVALFDRMLAGDLDQYALDKRAIRKDGTIIHVAKSVAALRDSRGEFEAALIHLVDIGDRVAAQSERDRSIFEQRERIKELRCMHGVAVLVAAASDTGTLIAQVVELLPDAMQFPESAGASITLDGVSASTPLFSQTPWMLSTSCPGVSDSCTVSVCYVDEHPAADDGPFLAEEHDLVDWIAATLAEGVRRIRAAESGAAREREFRGTFDQAAVGMAHVSPEGRFIRVNGRLAHLLGYAEPELLATDFQTITHPDDLATDEALVGQVLAGTIDHYSLEKRYIRKDGSSVWANLTVGLVREDGEPAFFVATIEDISERKAVEEALRAQTEMLEQFFSLTLDLLCVADTSGRFRKLNQAWETTLGYTSDELMAGRFFDFIHPDDIEPTSQAVATLEGQVPVTKFVNRYRHKDGTYRWLEWRSAPSGELIFASARDITESRAAQERLRETTAYLESLIEYANAPIIVWNPERTITRFNHAAEHLTGIAASDAIGRDLAALFPDESRDDALEEIARTLVGEGWESVEIPIQRAGGEVRLTLWNSACIYAADNETIIAVIAQGQDITERKAAEDALRDLTLTLEDRVQQRTAELTAANAELESFAYAVSHDLRAPLRSVDGFSRALEDDYGAILDDQAHDYLQRLRAASQRMAVLIDDLLQLSRLTRAEMTWGCVDVSEMARGILGEYAAAAPERAATIEVDEGICVTGDARLLRVAVENLLSNAWKFSRDANPALIRVSSTVAEDGATVLAVSDNGAGFDMTYVEKLFRPFQRLHSSTQFEGTGIGLATVQRVAHRHGGRVWAQGVVDGGATFYMAMPAASAQRDAGTGEDVGR